MRRTAVIAAVVVVVVVGADLVAGILVRGRIAALAGRHLTGRIEVATGDTPVLVDLLTGRFPTITVRAPATTACGLGPLSVAVDLRGVRRTAAGAAVAASRLSVGIPTATLTTDLRRGLHGLVPATVSTDPAAATLVVGLGGLLRVGLRPVVAGHAVIVQVASAQILGHSLPAPLGAALRRALTFDEDFTGLPLDLTVRSVAVTRTGLSVVLTGGRVWVASRAGSAGRSRCPA